MTAIIGLIEKDFAIIASDTLSTYPLKDGDVTLQPYNYTSKTFLLPQFKSAFSVVGILQLGLCFHEFMVEKALGIDIDSIVNINLSFLKDTLESKYEQTPTGSIYLVGFSYSSEHFKCFKLVVTRNGDLIWEQFPGFNFFFKPYIENWEEKLSLVGESEDYSTMMIRLMKIQKSEDEVKDVSERVGIGGEIIYTQLIHDVERKEIMIVSRIPYKFEDYDSQGERMMINSLR